MSSKMQFQIFYGEYNVMYGPNGVDLSAFKCTSSAIDSWGEAVLAATYRGLCDGCMKTHGNDILAGCPILLQL